MTNSRLHIPMLYGVDAVHGHNNVLGATIFPQEIGMGSTWDPSLVKDEGAAAARAVAATGIDWNFAPVTDIARDQRWGRYYETYGEDPLLAGTLAASAVKGIQNAGGAKDVAATVKHFAGYGEPGNGHDRVPGDVSMRYLQDTLLPSYKHAIDAGAKSVMVNSGAINGIPATSSHYLLTDVLRKQWGFKGVVVSDWQDVRALQTAYHVAADYPDAIAKAVNAGLDMAMEPYDAQGWSDGLRTAVQRGLVSVHRIDQSVARILTHEVPARPLRTPLRGRLQGRRAGDRRRHRHSPARPPTSRRCCCATTATCCPSPPAPRRSSWPAPTPTTSTTRPAAGPWAGRACPTA